MKIAVTGLLKLTSSACLGQEIVFLPNPIWFESHKNQCLFTEHEPTLTNNPTLDKI